MSQITARLPEEMVKEIDHAAQVLHRSRADFVRKAIEIYLEDFADLNTAIDRLRDSADRNMDWEHDRGQRWYSGPSMTFVRPWRASSTCITANGASRKTASGRRMKFVRRHNLNLCPRTQFRYTIPAFVDDMEVMGGSA